MKNILTVISILWWSSASNWAQEAVISAYSVNEGLSQGTITAFYQDSKGYLWVGSGHGLNVFNGYGFKSFLHTNDPRSISNDVVRGIFEDSQKHLWIATERNLNLYNPGTGVFSVSNNSAFENTIVRVVHERGAWLYALESLGGLVRFKKEDQNVIEKYEADTLAKGYCVRSNGTQIVYAVSRGHLLITDIESGVTERRIFPELSGSYITTILELSEDEVGVSCTNGFFIINLRENICLPFSASTNNVYVTAACVDKRGLIWLSIQGNGLSVWNPQGEMLNAYSSSFRPMGLPAFSSIQVQELMCDRNGNVWIGTDAMGLIQIRTQNLRFGNVMIPRVSDEDAQPIVWSFIRDQKNQLWVGTNRGIYVFDTDYRLLRHLQGWNELGQDKITAFQDVEESTIVAFGQNDMVTIDIGSGEYKHERIMPEDRYLKISAAVKGLSGDIWIGTNRGLLRYIHGKGLVERIFPYSVSFLHRTPKDELFVGFRQRGVSKFDGNGWNEVLSFEDQPQTKEVVMVRSMSESSDGGFWLGTSTGLFLVDKNFSVQRILSIEDGLPDTYINAIIAAEVGVYWISTNKGLSRFDSNNYTFQNFIKQDGLQSNEFNAASAYKDSYGELYFGGVEGFNHFSDKGISQNVSAAEILVENFKIGNRTIGICDTTCAYEVPYSENGFTLDLCVMDFTNPNRNRYSYMLVGFDTTFYDAGLNRTVRYAGLPPGKYTFLARSSIGGGPWSESEVLFEINIVKPFWMRFWFIALCFALTVLFIVWIFVSLQKKKYRKQIEELRHQREIEAIRNTISGDIHDEIGAGLTRIALLTDSIVLSKDKDSDQWKLMSLGQLARSLSGSLKEVIWSTNPGYDTLNDLIVHLRSYSSDYLEDAGIDVFFELYEPSHRLPLNPVVRRSIFMIAKEALTNVVRHADARKVTLSFKVSNDEFEMKISDNGKGFSTNSQGEGHGIKSMSRRAEQAGFHFEVLSENGKGTIVRVQGSLVAKNT